MKICGIICEFNPLHNGHEYLIKQAKSQGYTVICLMSGNFTQRGLPARVEKYDRAKAAIMAGASMVLELPFVYAVNGADEFSYGAIKILKALGVDTLFFGSECGDLKTLNKLAYLKVKESQKFKDALKQNLKKGYSYSHAYSSAMSNITSSKTLISAASSPNDLLASSYIYQIKNQKANITPIVIKRQDNGFFSFEPKNKFMSASSILSFEEQGLDFSQYLPEYSKKLIQSSPKFDKSIFHGLLTYKINNTNLTDLQKLFGVNEGLEYSLINCFSGENVLKDPIDKLKSKRYRESRLQKLFLYTLVELKSKDYELIKKSSAAVKVLAVKRSEKQQLLSKFKNRKIKLLTTNRTYLELTRAQSASVYFDLKASDIYSICTKTPLNKDRSKGTLFLDM